MKIRNDFVSNSSSCSFIIKSQEDVKSALDILFKTFTPDDVVPYDMDLEVCISAKNRDFRDVETLLTGGSEYKSTYSDYRTGEICQKDPDEIGWDRIRMSLGSFLESVQNPEIQAAFDKIERIEFECDDYDMSKREMLTLLYSFFMKHNCHPDAEDSEHDFTDSNDSSFLKKLMS